MFAAAFLLLLLTFYCGVVLGRPQSVPIGTADSVAGPQMPPPINPLPRPPWPPRGQGGPTGPNGPNQPPLPGGQQLPSVGGSGGGQERDYLQTSYDIYDSKQGKHVGGSCTYDSATNTITKNGQSQPATPQQVEQIRNYERQFANQLRNDLNNIFQPGGGVGGFGGGGLQLPPMPC